MLAVGCDRLMTNSPQTAILVLGMHRSGTSAVTRALNLLGAALPSDLIPSDAKENPAGFWESAAIIKAHDNFLASIGSSWSDPLPLPPETMRSEAATECRQALEQILIRDFATAPLFAIKDPRMCRLVPLWLEILAARGISAKIVMPIRHPGEVTMSLRRRNDLATDQALAAWLFHTMAAETATRHLPRAIVDYHQLARSPERALRQMLKELGNWPADDEAISRAAASIDGQHRHHDASALTDCDVPGWIERLYFALIGRPNAKEEAAKLSLEVNRVIELLQPFLSNSYEWSKRVVALTEANSRQQILINAAQQRIRSKFWRFITGMQWIIALFRLTPALFGGLLDPSDYRAMHGQSWLPPLFHYLLIGHWRGLTPTSSFDPFYYLENNPDVALSGAHPLDHFLRLGRSEGRKARAFTGTQNDLMA
jgi:hypothetical protein